MTLIRHAPQEHLKRLYGLQLEELDRRGYLNHPQHTKEYSVWEDVAAWPEDPRET